MGGVFAVILLPLIVTSGVEADDMQQYLSDTVELVQKGKYEEALKRHLWFHEHALEHEPGMYGVRLSFALSYWKQLGTVYPPAIEAMKKVRDEKTLKMEKGEGRRELFHDVTALNRTLDENGKTVKLFRKLDQEQPALAKACWLMGRDEIFEARAYDLVKKYAGNLIGEYEQMKQSFDEMKSIVAKMKDAETAKANMERRFVDDTLQLIEIAVGIDDMEAARQIQSKALGVVYDERLKAAIPEQP